MTNADVMLLRITPQQLPPGIIPVIARGLSFIPASIPNATTTATNIDSSTTAFKRRLMLARHFNFQQRPPFDTNSNTTLYDSINAWCAATNGGFNVPDHWYQELATQLIGVMRQLRQTIAKFNATDNLSGVEREAMETARHTANWIVRPSDKGGFPVVTTVDHYREAGMLHVNDTNLYEPHANPQVAIDDALTAIRRVARAAPKDVKPNVTRHLSYTTTTHRDFQIPMLYLLFKTGKFVQDNPDSELITRPIAANVNFPTSRAANLISLIAVDMTRSDHLILQDTTALVQHLETRPHLQRIPANARLVSFDVVALYPSINIQLLIDIFRQRLRRHYVNETMVTWLVQLLEVVLHHNYCDFDGRTYRQKQGLAMGVKPCAALGNMYVADLLTTKVESADGSMGACNYIDDIFTVTTATDGELEQLHNQLNNTAPGLSVTKVVGERRLTILDIDVVMVSNRDADNTYHLEVVPYTKPSARGLFIPPMSHHTKHALPGMIRGETLRLIRNSTREVDFITAHAAFVRRLYARAYKRDYIVRAIKGLSWSQRQHYLLPKRRHADDGVYAFVVQYNARTATMGIPPIISQLNGIMRQHGMPPQQRVVTAWSSAPTLQARMGRQYLPTQRAALMLNSRTGPGNR